MSDSVSEEVLSIYSPNNSLFVSELVNKMGF